MDIPKEKQAVGQEVLYKFYGGLVSLPFCYLLKRLGMIAQFMGDILQVLEKEANTTEI